MRPEYKGVKFYSASDNSIGYELRSAEPILEAFNPEKEYSDVNEVLELYNIQQLIEIAYLPEWSEQTKQRYHALLPRFRSVIGRFFSRINDENFKEIRDSVCLSYWGDFWEVFEKYKTYLRISKEVFSDFLNEPETTLTHLLHHKELVKHFDHEFAEKMRQSSQTARLIVAKHLEKHLEPVTYYFPKELQPEEYHDILQRSIDSGEAGIHMLQLLENAQSSKECPVSDKLRQSARHAAKEFWNKRSDSVVKSDYSISLSICEQPEWKKVTQQEHDWDIRYDARWLVNNLDHPTILDNFIYTFEQFDICGRSVLYARDYQAGVFERFCQTRGVKDYPTNNAFNFLEALTTMQTGAYYSFLYSRNIHLDDVFKWFFEEYLPKEFGVLGFRFNPPSVNTTPVEKCRTIASEMDGVLKQFRMYVEDGQIDWELFTMSSSQIVFSEIPSFHPRKYAYITDGVCKAAQKLLFSDQSILVVTKKIAGKYKSFYRMLTHEKIYRSDFEHYQDSAIQMLIDQEYIVSKDNNLLATNDIRCAILKDAYENMVLCPLWVPQWQDEIDKMFTAGDLHYESTLFSKPEAEYLNYMLNKSNASNGLDLRNKYIHGSYLSDDNVAMSDYMRLLKIMVLVIGKINEEFDLRDKVNS